MEDSAMQANHFLEKIKDQYGKRRLFKITGDKIKYAISLLETQDIKLRYYLGDLISYQGKKSIPELLKTLHDSLPEIRRSTVFLLGKILMKFPTPEATKELLSSLLDKDPKTRKNAAIVIGRLEIKGSENKLMKAVLKENTDWVKSSMILAIGAVGGEKAKEFLISYQATGDSECEALRKAVDRVSGAEKSKWRFKRSLSSPLSLELWTLKGLEKILADEVKNKFGLPTKIIKDGVLVTKYGKLPELFSLRTFSELLIPLSSSKIKSLENCLLQLEILFKNKALFEGIMLCHEKEQTPLCYRIEIKGDRVGRDMRRQIVEKITKTIQIPLFINSPSNYDIELRLVIENDNLKVLWKPFTIPDNRFSYRLKDVPASINPVVAAGIISLLKSKLPFSDSNRALDPFCGSGTILMERAFGGKYQELIGIDISKSAVEAARENVKNSQFDRIVIMNKDMRNISKSESFDEIITNMPFGIRTGNHTSNKKLYMDFFSLIPSILKPKGFLVLFTQEIRLTNQLFVEFKRDLCLVETHRIESGGLRPAVFIAVKNE